MWRPLFLIGTEGRLRRGSVLGDTSPHTAGARGPGGPAPHGQCRRRVLGVRRHLGELTQRKALCPRTFPSPSVAGAPRIGAATRTGQAAPGPLVPMRPSPPRSPVPWPSPALSSHPASPDLCAVLKAADPSRPSCVFAPALPRSRPGTTDLCGKRQVVFAQNPAMKGNKERLLGRRWGRERPVSAPAAHPELQRERKVRAGLLSPDRGLSPR